MSGLLVHDMETAWASSDQSLLGVSRDAQVFVEGAACNRLEAQPGARGESLYFTPGTPLDLRGYDELRFWVRANAPATGKTSAPFYLEFSFADAADAAGEEHRWFVPVNQAGVWEQRRIGIGADRRGAVQMLRFKCLTDLPFVCHVDELLAVSEEMLIDVERALREQLDEKTALPGLTNLPLSQTAKPGDTQIVLPYAPGFEAGNRIVVRGGSAGDERHAVKYVTHDKAAGTTTLKFADEDKVAGTLTAASASASVSVQLFFETPPEPTSTPYPAIIATLLDMREDRERTSDVVQRDSFRPRGDLVSYSTRPGARAYMLDYQFTAVAANRAHQLHIYTHLLRHLSSGAFLRINGAPAPVWPLPAPPLEERALGVLSPVYARVGTRMETAARTEVPGVSRFKIVAGHLDARLEREEVTL